MSFYVVPGNYDNLSLQNFTFRNSRSNLNSKAPVEWQIAGKNVVPEVLVKESNGRITVSITDRIHIQKSKLADSDIYR